MKLTCVNAIVINSCLRAPIILQKSISSRAMSSWVDEIANRFPQEPELLPAFSYDRPGNEFDNFGAQTVQCAPICVIR